MIKRREFLSSLLAVSLAGQTKPPARTAKVTPLFKSPDRNPNGLEASEEGLWIGEQTTDRAYMVNWTNGYVMRSVQTESSNTSGIAYGGGFLWMAANGPSHGRPPKPSDAKTGEVIKADPWTGRTLGRYPIPGGGGVHGLEFAEGTLWITSLKLQKLSQVDPKDFRVIQQIPVHLGRAHGLAWDPPGPAELRIPWIWCMHSDDRVIHKLNPHSGLLLEVVTLSKSDPDPHGMCLYKGHLYYCDAGIAPGGGPNHSLWAGYVCRIDLA